MIELADAGMVGCMVINDMTKANVMVQRGVEYVGFRFTATEGMPDLYHNRDDYGQGKDWWFQNRTALTTGLDRRVYIKPFNEKNQRFDGWFVRGLLEAAHGDGWRLAAFGDGVGHPADFREEPPHSGQYISETWSDRVDSGAMAEGVRGGSLCCLNQYGRMEIDAVGNAKETDDPGSAIWPDGRRDDPAFFWFGGRHRSVYDHIPIPPECRMKVLVGEAGPSDAIFRGAARVLSDIRGYQERYANDPDIAAFCYWTVGGSGAYGFGYSTLDTALPDIKVWVGAQRR